MKRFSIPSLSALLLVASVSLTTLTGCGTSLLLTEGMDAPSTETNGTTGKPEVDAMLTEWEKRK